MNFIKKNKGVIILYLMLAFFTFALVENAKVNIDINNSYVMLEK